MLPPPGSPAILALCLAVWLLLVNSLTVAAFRIDRRRAKAGEWRVPKQTLLMLATLGGWPGAKLTQILSERKLHRLPFRVLLDVSIVPMALLAGYLTVAQSNWQNTTPEVAAQSTAEVASAPVAPAKPQVVNFAKAEHPASVVTSNPDLPRRIGPATTKTGAWHSR